MGLSRPKDLPGYILFVEFEESASRIRHFVHYDSNKDHLVQVLGSFLIVDVMFLNQVAVQCVASMIVGMPTLAQKHIIVVGRHPALYLTTADLLWLEEKMDIRWKDGWLCGILLLQRHEMFLFLACMALCTPGACRDCGLDIVHSSSYTT